MIRPHYLPRVQALAGRDGELVLIRIAVEARLLEQLLEALAAATPYHINPELFPNTPQGSLVEFPAYESWVEPIGEALRKAGLAPARFETARMTAQLAS